jgi:hypothetical protein
MLHVALLLAGAVGEPGQTRRAAPALLVRAYPARGPIRVDGRLDEPDWRNVDSITRLVQVVPREGAGPSARTVIRVLVQVDALVVGVSADDADPAGIVASPRSATPISSVRITSDSCSIRFATAARASCLP